MAGWSDYRTVRVSVLHGCNPVVFILNHVANNWNMAMEEAD